MSFQAGLLHFDLHPIAPREIAAILDSVANCRGYEAATWQQEGLIMAHADPFVIGPACQPCVTDTAVITFDGRIDNREDLLCPRNETDAALALTAYRRAGCGGFASLIGDWSLAIWNRQQRQLILASDFAGVRPLYYSVSSSGIRWSTSLAPLADSAPTRNIDDEFVAGFLTSVGAPNRTPWRGVFSVPPGHFLIASAGKIDVRPFWTLPVQTSIRYAREAEYDEHLRHLFREAVECRLRTGHPVLAEFSGGLDSSSIACMANRLGASNFIALTYEREGSRDRPFQEILESFCGFKTIRLSTAQHAFLTESHPGEAAPAFWEDLNLAVAKLARQLGARTLMTGSMGDLVMGNWHDDSAQILGSFRKGHCLDGLRESLAWSQALGIPILWVLARAMLSAAPPLLSRWLPEPPLEASTASTSRDDSIAPEFRKRLDLNGGPCSSRRPWAEAPPERRNHFRALAGMLELRRLQPPEPLEHLAYTHPFSHRPLVEYMLSVPPNILCGPGEPRRLMRRAFQDLWPPELQRRRSKDSFGGVFLDSLRSLAASLLKHGRPLQVVERGYVDPVSLDRRLHRMTHSLDCNEAQLRQIILLEFWLRSQEIPVWVQAKACTASEARLLKTGAS